MASAKTKYWLKSGLVLLISQILSTSHSSPPLEETTDEDEEETISHKPPVSTKGITWQKCSYNNAFQLYAVYKAKILQ